MRHMNDLIATGFDLVLLVKDTIQAMVIVGIVIVVVLGAVLGVSLLLG